MTIIRWRQWKVWGYVLEGELAELGSLGVAMSSQVVYYRWAHWWQKGLLYFGRNTETVKTPEPCSLCSFVALSSWAIDLSCRYLETAQKQELETGKTFSLENPHELSVNAEPLGLRGARSRGRLHCLFSTEVAWQQWALCSPFNVNFNFEEFLELEFCKNKNAMCHPAVTSRCCFPVSSASGIRTWVELVD